MRRGIGTYVGGALWVLAAAGAAQERPYSLLDELLKSDTPCIRSYWWKDAANDELSRAFAGKVREAAAAAFRARRTGRRTVTGGRAPGRALAAAAIALREDRLAGKALGEVDAGRPFLGAGWRGGKEQGRRSDGGQNPPGQAGCVRRSGLTDHASYNLSRPCGAAVGLPGRLRLSSTRPANGAQSHSDKAIAARPPASWRNLSVRPAG